MKGALLPLLTTVALAGQIILNPGSSGGVAPGGTASPVVQIAYTQSGALATGTTTIPIDDTIPQITEGDQYLTLVFDPEDAANELKIEAIATFGHSGNANYVTAALFRDEVANALAADSTVVSAAHLTETLPLTHFMTAGTDSPITFRLRLGSNVAGTLSFNGVVGARLFGGVAASTITVTEFDSTP